MYLSLYALQASRFLGFGVPPQGGNIFCLPIQVGPRASLGAESESTRDKQMCPDIMKFQMSDNYDFGRVFRVAVSKTMSRGGFEISPKFMKIYG